MNTKTCPRCGACWINDQHYWTGTNKKGDETKLASLICDHFKDPNCINPKRGTTDGEEFRRRQEDFERIKSDMDAFINKHK